MTTPTTAELLKYADLQMAAEAFIRDKNEFHSSGQELIDALKAGNGHASKFTETQAIEFEKHWKVLDQKANTTTGFSGTLFQNKDTNELVMSMRSTEFLDDAVRDNQATNVPEVKGKGWAFGQIADMEDWYKSLKDSGKIANDAQFSVTGYSLGGHLATAFTLLHSRDWNAQNTAPFNPVLGTYTFNCAGVGKVNGTTLNDVIANFDRQRKNLSGNEITFTTPDAQVLYEQLSPVFKAGVASYSSTYIKAEAARIEQMRTGVTVVTPPIGPIPPISTRKYFPTQRNDELGQLQQALEGLASIVSVAERVNAKIPSGDGVTFAGPVETSQIAAVALDYQAKLLVDRDGAIKSIAACAHYKRARGKFLMKSRVAGASKGFHPKRTPTWATQGACHA